MKNLILKISSKKICEWKKSGIYLFQSEKLFDFFLDIQILNIRKIVDFNVFLHVRKRRIEIFYFYKHKIVRSQWIINISRWNVWSTLSLKANKFKEKNIFLQTI